MRIGTWAIEEMKRVRPYKKPDMMGVVTEPSADVREGTNTGHKTPMATTTTPSAPPSLYPALPIPLEEKAAAPPPYSQNPF